MTEIKFLLTIRGILTAEPTMLAPVMKIPLSELDTLYLPSSSDNGETKRQSKAEVEPGVWTDAVEDIHPTSKVPVHTDLNCLLVVCS